MFERERAPNYCADDSVNCNNRNQFNNSITFWLTLIQQSFSRAVVFVIILDKMHFAFEGLCWLATCNNIGLVAVTQNNIGATIVE